jgi:hypothetical protein
MEVRQYLQSTEIHGGGEDGDKALQGFAVFDAL